MSLFPRLPPTVLSGTFLADVLFRRRRRSGFSESPSHRRCQASGRQFDTALPEHCGRGSRLDMGCRLAALSQMSTSHSNSELSAARSANSNPSGSVLEVIRPWPRLLSTATCLNFVSRLQKQLPESCSIRSAYRFQSLRLVSGSPRALIASPVSLSFPPHCGTSR